MIQEYLLPEIEDINTDNTSLQQDEATAHLTEETFHMLKTIFADRMIYRFKRSRIIFLWILKGKILQ